MKAVKGNKEYSIDETQKNQYQESGFDIKDDSGSVIAYGRGKTVPFGDYMAAVMEIESCHARIAELEEITQGESRGKSEEKPTEKKPAVKKADGNA